MKLEKPPYLSASVQELEDYFVAVNIAAMLKHSMQVLLCTFFAFWIQKSPCSQSFLCSLIAAVLDLHLLGHVDQYDCPT
jgi:hypothetical protein